MSVDRSTFRPNVIDPLGPPVALTLLSSFPSPTIRATRATTSGVPMSSSQAAPTTSAGYFRTFAAIHAPSTAPVGTGVKRPYESSRHTNASIASTVAARTIDAGRAMPRKDLTVRVRGSPAPV